jgi:hypothetical protein
MYRLHIPTQNLTLVYTTKAFNLEAFVVYDTYCKQDVMDKETKVKVDEKFYKDLLEFEHSINQQIKDFQDKWEEYYYKVNLHAIDVISPAYNKERGVFFNLFHFYQAMIQS